MAKKSKIKKQASFTNPDQNMQSIDITEIAGDGFGKYAEYVIIQRSLPDVRDGLIPVQRRNLFGMYKKNWSSKKPYVKSAKIVGEVMGSYHPHGDCLHKDTKVTLLNGNVLTIEELYKLGKDVDVLAIDINGKIVPAKAHSFRIGQYTDTIYNIKLTNGSVIKVTGNHPFRMLDGSWVKAEDLKPLTFIDYGKVTTKDDYKLIKGYNTNLTTLHGLVYGNKKDTESKEKINNFKGELPTKQFIKLVKELNRIPTLNKFVEMTNTNYILEFCENDEDLVDIMSNEIPLIQEIFIEEVNQEPMYDFTVDNHENMLISVSNDNTLLASVHNSAIYGALARMSKEWLMGIPMVDMSGNNGSIDGDSEAAMRYCITGDSLVSLADGSLKQISEIVKNSELNTTTDIELSVLDSKGLPVTASKFFNSGKHDIKEIILENGNGLKGSYNHPVLTLISKDGVPTLEWKLLENIKVGDFVVQLKSELNKNSNFKITNTGIEIAELGTDYIFTKVSEVNNLDKEVVYSIRVDSEEHSFIANGIVNHNTESRLSSYSEDLLLSNLSLKGIVPEKLNYDDTLYEPIYLPAKVPNILINGSEGIAVGYASNIPTFNLNEVLDACIAELRNPNIEDSELITYIPAPDFSTGGTIADYKSYADALISGRGGIKVRGNYTIEEDKKNKEIHIIFHEIPYGSVKPKIINTVIESINNKEISGIKEIRDDSDLDTGVSLVVTCNESANIDGILSFLFSKTDLQRNVPLNITAISKNKPKVLGVTQIIRDFNVFRRETFIRGLQIQIKELEFKKHLNEGFVLLVDNIEKVIELIKNSDSKSDAFEELLKIGFSKVQAKRVLDMSLHRINKSDKEAYESIVNDCQKQIDQRNTILSSDELTTQAIIKAYEKIQKEYETPRKTILKEEPENWDFSPESVIPKEKMAVGITKDGFIKVSNFRSYKTSTVENDKTDFILETDTTQSIIIITEKGECAYIPVHKLPTTRWSDNGKHLSTFGLDIGTNEIAFAETYDGKDKDKTIFLIKDNGVGKQSLAFDYVKNRGHFTLTSGIKCKDDEKVLGGWLLDKNEDNFIALMDNKYANMYFEAEEMPITSVKSGGANAMRLNKKQGRVITEFKLYHNISEIPPFCKPRERGQAGWNRKKTEEPVSLYDFKPLEQEQEN